MYANSKVLPEGNISGSTSLYVNKAEPKSEAVAKVDSNSLQPDRIKISSLNIDAQSVTVGLTSDNAVDVPEKYLMQLGSMGQRYQVSRELLSCLATMQLATVEFLII